MTTTPTTVCQMAVAIEIAAAKWVVVSTTGGLRRQRRRVLAQATATERFAALRAELDEARRKLNVAMDARVVVAYEAGQEGFWLVRALRAAGVEAEVIDPVSLPVDRRARRAKTDRLDGEALSLALWYWLGGDERALRMVRVPSVEAEDAREWQRERDRLKTEHRSVEDRITKKLRTQGIWERSRTWRSDLRDGALRTFAGTPLGAQLQAALVVELARLELIEAKLKEWQAQQADLPAATTQTINHLAHLRGVGPVGATALATQLFWRTFDNRRQVGACVGLTGTPYDSGTLRQDQGISKAGDPKLRALLVELAWLWLRLQPDSAITRWFRERTQGAGKRGKRVMIVAVARKLAVALWRYVQLGEIPQGARLKAA
ncbi:MAG: IS110 family transposase [Rhodanobacteraceae bacterium]|nr:IS110 family transposase [Rhodanobacteraceae bacterium]NCT69020.1 IS110 family transposase [Rhodanobacteraceae bacterium]